MKSPLLFVLQVVDSLNQTQATQSDWTDVVNAGAAVVSSIVALIAVMISIRGLKDAIRSSESDRNWRREAAHQNYYKAIVSDPIFKEVSEYRDSVKELIVTTLPEIRRLQEENYGSQDIERRIRDFLDAFSTYQAGLKDLVLDAARAWGGDGFFEEARDLLEKTENDFLNEAEKLMNPKHISTLDSLYDDSLHTLRRLVRDTDPLTMLVHKEKTRVQE